MPSETYAYCRAIYGKLLKLIVGQAANLIVSFHERWQHVLNIICNLRGWGLHITV